MSIRLSERHGVNPSLMKCFYCYEDVGVALLGRLPGDEEAPRALCLDREPCDKCKGYMEQGIILISVDEDKSEERDNPWRTGGWCVVTEKYIRRIFQPPELVEDVCKKRVAFVPDDAWAVLGLPRPAPAD